MNAMLNVRDDSTETTLVKTHILDQLLEVSEAMLRGDYSKRIVSDFNDDIITRICDNLNRFSDKIQLNPSSLEYNQEETVNKFIEVITSFATLDFKQKLTISDSGTIMDAIATGINVLGDELERSTASKQELESERNRLNEAQAIVKVGSWEIDLKTLDLTWSNEAYRIFEVERRPGKNLYHAYLAKIHPADVSMIEALLKEALLKSQTYNVEFRIICNDGSTRYIFANGEVVRDGGDHPIGLKGIIQDITERREVEQALKIAKENAENANNAKSLFLANMSHEIRTPLNGILGLTEIMLGDGVHEEHRRYLEIIGASGKNLSKLINDILDLSKIESGKLKLEHIPFNLNDIITSNINSYKLPTEQKGIAITYRFDEAIPKNVIGDPTRISQILTNLVGNAIKFTDEGTIDISFTLLENNVDEVCIQGIVRDTGIGIPPAIQTSIFESFMQADDSVTRKYGGTGLGLSIVKSLLNQMKGDIRIESPNDREQNKGSSFIFSMWLKVYNKIAEKDSATDPKTFKLQKPLHILIVDDNQINLLVARRMVEKFGATVTAVDSGLKAIEKVKSADYDFILMDIQMPVLDGYQTTQELRKLNYSKPIVALSAIAYHEDVQNSLNSGMNDHLQKPYSEENLFKVIAKFVE